MTILVTGAFGFLGCHLLATLAERGGGERIVAADLEPPDDVSGKVLAMLGDRARATRLDVSDRAAVEALVVETRPREVIHAAAVTPSPDDAAPDAARIVDINVGGTVSLLRALQRAGGGQRVVLISSSAVYGARAAPGAAAESDAVAPQTLYGATKAAAETLAFPLAASSKIDLLVVRLGGLFGRFERPTRTRARMSPVHRLAAALRAGRKVHVAGGDVARDYACADEAADAILRLLRLERWPHSIVNIGGDQVIAWRQLVGLFASHGLDATWDDAAPEPGLGMTPADARPALDIGRLRAMIGGWPRRPLDDAIAQLIADDSRAATGEAA